MTRCLTAPSHYLNQFWLSLVRFGGIQLRAISLDVLKIAVIRICYETTHLNLPPHSLQNKCRTTDPDQQNLGRSGKLSFFVIYKFWQNCASVRQVSDLILKTDISTRSQWVNAFMLFICPKFHRLGFSNKVCWKLFIKSTDPNPQQTQQIVNSAHDVLDVS